MESEYWSIQNHPKGGVCTVMQWADNHNRGVEIAYTSNGWLAMNIAEAMNMAAAGERAAELLLPPEEAKRAMAGRKFAVD